ncbi:PepSY-associated TM helix domain-containing protein [Arenimonas sp.]|uniref:PepSY-associated TM helix domain-containing protein n=1 Tax=Arenimonas sp. TaxID=1872635 RepID=UPI0025C3727D|nr:PepSY-associated TM helix domain-containing protein [Arenimonas sp.]
MRWIRFLGNSAGGGWGRAPRGEAFFRKVMQIHRWLAADAVGKQIVGASTVALVFFCLSGLYLRWPRKAWRWRSWLVLHWRLTGRGFLRQLHVIIGTWLVLAYLLMAVTGLTWSYPAFRTALQDLAGMPAPAIGGGPRGAASGSGSAAPEAPRVDVGAAFAAFHANVPSFSRVTLRLPAAPGQALELSYLDSDPEHERASHRLVLDAASLAVTAHERHDQKPVGQRLVASLFPLHSGSYFGWPGLLLFCLASLAMPLFTVTGWQLYLDRRAKNKRRRNAPARA